MAWYDIASWTFLLFGSFLCITGGIGLHRMPDFYARTHAASITDTLGAVSVLLGLGFQCLELSWIISAKLVMVAVFLLVTSPTAGHALVKAAAAHGVRFVVPEPPKNEDGKTEEGASP